MIIQKSLFTINGIIFIGAVAIVIIVVAMIRYHMTKPSKVRSIQWLSSKGVAEIHISELFKPKLTLNSGSKNIMRDGDSVRVGIRSNADLNGYGYILTVESQDCKKLYTVCIGFIGEYSFKTRLEFPNGAMGSETLLAKLKLNPGDYIARLIFLNAVYGGNYQPSETIIDFNVSKKISTTPRFEPIRTEGNSSGYVFTVKNQGSRHKLINIEYNEVFTGNENISCVFSSDRLLRYLRKGYRPIAFFSKRGDIDRYDIERCLSPLNVFKKRIIKRIRNRLKSPGQLILLNRKPKSRLKTS